jgi:hypothetical protein
LEEGAVGLEFYGRWVTSFRKFDPFSQCGCAAFLIFPRNFSQTSQLLNQFRSDLREKPQA